MQFIDGGLQGGAIVGERLLQTSRLSSPDNRNEIRRFQARVDEVAQRMAKARHAREGEAEVIDDQHDRPLHLVGCEWRCVRRRRRD